MMCGIKKYICFIAALGILAISFVPVLAAEKLSADIPDGEYAIDVALEGGSGKASVESPTLLKIEDGKIFVQLVWSSQYYDYMIVDGVRYENEAESQMNSTFVIPVTAVDSPMTVTADTIAMGTPHEIEYRLTLYSDSIAGKENLPKEQARKVIWIALAIIVVGGILNHIVKKKTRV